MTTPFQLIDLSHTVEHGMITYKGLPEPVISDHMSREDSRKNYAAGTEFHIGRIEMVANTGTYLDSPFHRYKDGRDLSQIDLQSLANLDGVVITNAGERAVTKDYFDGFDVRGKAVLIRTGWDKHWRSDEYWSGKHPFLTKDAAEVLAERGAALVGIDSYNIDDTNDTSRPVHSVLLAKNIPIVEHMSHLDKLPVDGFTFFAVPVKVKDFGTFPVRAFALVRANA